MLDTAKCSDIPAEVAKVSDYKAENIRLIFAGQDILTKNTTLG